MESSSAFDAIDFDRVREIYDHDTVVSSSASQDLVRSEAIAFHAQCMPEQRYLPAYRSYPTVLKIIPECVEFIFDFRHERNYGPVEGGIESLASTWYQILVGNTVLEDDFTRVDLTSSFDNLLFFYDKRLRSIIDDLRRDNDIRYSDKLANRLTELISLGYEDEFDQIPIKLGSLNNFIRFIKSNKNIKRPNVVLTPSREIQTQWGKSKDKKLIVIFLEGGEISFVLYVKNKIKPKKIDRHASTTTTDMLLNIIKPCGAHKWVLDSEYD